MSRDRRGAPAGRRSPTLADRRPLRVLHFITGFSIGGSERQTVALVRGLHDAGHDVRLACFRNDGTLFSEVDDLPCHVFHTDSFFDPRIVLEQARFARLLRRHEIDVVHATGLHPNVFAVPAARLAGAPAVVASVRDLGDMWTGLQRRAQRLACRWADRVVVNAEAVARGLVEEGYDRRRIAVIHNSVVTPPPAAARATRPGDDPLAREFGVPAGAPVVGVVARLVRVKGLEYFVDAAAELAPRYPDARFVLVGGGVAGDESASGRTYESELRERAQRAGVADRVVFTGYRNDVPALLDRFDVSVLPSLSEGLSNALLESLAAGVPAVATRVGGNPEIVEDGVTGILVPPRDGHALAAAVARLLDRPKLARRLARDGRRRMLDRFTPEALVASTDRLYRTLVDRGPRARATEPAGRSAGAERTASVEPAASADWQPAWRRR